MHGKAIQLLFILLLNMGFQMFSADEKKPVLPSAQAQTQAQPNSSVPGKKSHYFQDSGSEMDDLLDRIRFKISYSWGKSAEYFRLACSSVTDSLPAKGRDLKAHADSKKDDLLEKGRQAVRETTEQTMRDLSRKGDEVKQDLDKMGNELKSEAVKEIRENTDKMFK